MAPTAERSLSPWHGLAALLLRSLSVCSSRLAIFFWTNENKMGFFCWFSKAARENSAEGGLTAGVALHVLQQVGGGLGRAQPGSDLG